MLIWYPIKLIFSTAQLPNSSALNAAKELIKCGIDLNKICTEDEYILIGHKQVASTECPGQALYNEIKTWPRYEPHP